MHSLLARIVADQFAGAMPLERAPCRRPGRPRPQTTSGGVIPPAWTYMESCDGALGVRLGEHRPSCTLESALDQQGHDEDKAGRRQRHGKVNEPLEHQAAFANACGWTSPRCTSTAV